MSMSKIDSRLKSFGRFVRRCISDWRVPGCAVGIVKGNRTIYTQSYGLRDVEANLPVTTETLFAIGSCTKAITATAIGILVDEGRLEWDKPVKEYVPEFRMHDPAVSRLVTLRDLVTHRAGLPQHAWVHAFSSVSRSQLLKRVRHLECATDFRGRFLYSNLSYILAAAVLEHVTGEMFEDLIKRYLLEPLAMNCTMFPTDAPTKEKSFIRNTQ